MAAALKLLWVTPFSTRSAIGTFSRLVTEEIAKRGVLDVTIGACDVSPVAPEAAQKTHLPLLLDAAEVAERLHDFDIVLYNVGNSYPFHGALSDLLRKRSGIFVIHDLYLYDLFYGILQARGKLGDHDRIVTATYQREIDFISQDTDYGRLLSHRVANYPMAEWFAAKALACIVHGKFAIPALEAATAGPVVYTPLVVYDPALPRAMAHRTRHADEKVRVTTFGDVNPNKRIDAVIRTIGSSAMLRNAIHYTVVGNAPRETRSQLEGLATSLGVSFEMTGYATDEEWAAQLEQTDIAAALRFPTTETGSASIAGSILAGLPVLVTDTGCYRELPDDIVFKVDPEREAETLRAQLERLVREPNLQQRLEERVVWAREHFGAPKYAARVEELARDFVNFAPAVEVGLELADTAVLLGLGRNDPALASWIEKAGSLFVRHPEG